MSEFIKYNPENSKEIKKPTVELYGNEVDLAMIEYAKSIIDFNQTIKNRNNFESRVSWQKQLKDIDQYRKLLHDRATKIWLDSDFLNGVYNHLEETDENTFVYDQQDKEDKFKKTRKMVNRIATKIFIPIIELKDDNANKKIKFEFENTSIQDINNNLELYHNINELKNYFDTNKNSSVVFGTNTDKAINEYIEANNSFLRLLSRYEPGSEKAKKFIKNADENKTNFHRNIIRALIKDKLLPEINQREWLYDKWQDKTKNKLRILAEKFSEYYKKLV